MTALERHARFFDPHETGSVRLGQTYKGLRRLGVSLVWRIVLPPIIHAFLGYLTQGRLCLVIRIDRIARGKHPFDTGVFDENGQVDRAAIDTLFANVEGDAITAEEMNAVIRARGNRLPKMGKLAGAVGHWFSRKEIRLFFCVAADTEKSVAGRRVGAVTRARLERFYDGELLHDLARARALVASGGVVARRR